MAILSQAELREALRERPRWRREGNGLVREQAFRDYAGALAFVERIGVAAEDYYRHPDIAISDGNRVRVRIANVNNAGITDAELRLAAKVDEVALAPAHEPEREPELLSGRVPRAAAEPASGSAPIAAEGAASAAAPGAPLQPAFALVEPPPPSAPVPPGPDLEQPGPTTPAQPPARRAPLAVGSALAGLAVGFVAGAFFARR